MAPNRTASYRALSPSSKRARTIREKKIADAEEEQRLVEAGSGEHLFPLTTILFLTAILTGTRKAKSDALANAGKHQHRSFPHSLTPLIPCPLVWIRKRGHDGGENDDDDDEGDDEGENANDEHAPSTKKPAKKKARAEHAEASPPPEKPKRRRHRKVTDEEGETDPPQRKKRRGRGRKEKDATNDGDEVVADAMDPKSQHKGMFLFLYFLLFITNGLYI